jgi:lantibiotic modifying enzyme
LAGDSRAIETSATSHSDAPPISPLEAAVRIGRALCRSAFWDPEGGLCNWVGRSKAEFDRAIGRITPTSAALGPDLYLGSAGIALFLAQLHTATGDEEFRRTAVGGVARSIRRLRRPSGNEEPSPLSLFFGAFGFAYASWRLAALIGDDGLRAPVESIIRRMGEAISLPHDLDVMGGNAGAIPVLLAMRQTAGLERCGELAITLGEQLCQHDPTHSAASSIRADRESTSELEELTRSGLSHGASGIGLALLELHAATGRPAFRDAARRAFEYEDTLFDADRKNWADLRRPSGHSRYEIAWCNGAPGIALARLRAAALDPERKDSYLDMARIGLATTLDAIEKHLAIPRYDATPCHGLTGLIEIVWIAGRMLDEASYRVRAISAAQALIDRYADRGDWPSGLYSGGPNPSLMLGTAGIGYTFLRLHDPEQVPSVLWIGC